MYYLIEAMIVMENKKGNYVKRILLTAVLIFSLMSVFPPWEICSEGLKIFVGYSVIFISPERGAGIAIGHLFVQWIALFVVTAVLLYLVKKDLLCFGDKKSLLFTFRNLFLGT
jgi:hypothetical protein